MATKSKLNIEIQHFEGCPNGPKMIERVKKAIDGIKNDILYKEVMVETVEIAEKVKFRGSPTLLINSHDFENMPAPTEPALSCRYYQNGLPTISEIQEKINYFLK